MPEVVSGGEVKMIDKEGILHWCNSVEEQFHPREPHEITRGEKPRLIEEQFLATGIRYLKALCEEER